MLVYSRIWDISHCPVFEEDNDQRSIAQNAHDEDEGEHNRDDVGFRAVLVRGIGHFCRVDTHVRDILRLHLHPLGDRVVEKEAAAGKGILRVRRKGSCHGAAE